MPREMIGLFGKKVSTSNGKQYMNTNLPGVPDGRGFLGLRDKTTGEVFVPSVYYSLAKGKSVMYWDSEKNEVYSVGTWVADTDIMKKAKSAFDARFRKTLNEYELVAFSLKNDKTLPYYSGYLGSYGSSRVYCPGPCPMNRTMMNDIDTIVVLQKEFGKANKNDKKTKMNEGIKMIEVEEV